MTIVHKGNIQKFTEGAFREWGYEVATQEFRAQTVTERESWIHRQHRRNPASPWRRTPRWSSPAWNSRRRTSAQALQGSQRRARSHLRTHGHGAVEDEADDQRPHRRQHLPADGDPADEYAVLATPNLNGDYISDAARRRWADWASLPVPTSATSTPSSKLPTAPLPSTPTRTSSIPARSSCRA